jgi:hypothetical protein
MEPETVRLPEVLSVALLIARLPAMDEVVLMKSEPPERSSVELLDEIVKLLTASDTDEECVTVMSGRSMTASSEAVGTCWSFGLTELTQLLAESQSPPAGLVQTIVASNVRSSSRGTTGRKRRRSTRRDEGNDVSDER